MSHYLFESEWVVAAPVDEVFDVMVKVDDYASWWSSVRHSSLIEDGDDNGVGAKAMYSIRSPLGYSMDFEMTALEVDRPRRIYSLARGDLVGTGTHIFESRGDHTVVTYLWYVSTTKRWMNVVAPVAKPFFVWAHHHVMREGCAGLAQRLGVNLISTNSVLVEAPAAIVDPVQS